MYQLLNRTTRFENSPFAFPRMDYLRGRVNENYQRYVTERTSYPGRVDSSHLLSKILISLNVEFSGDLVKYMSDCEISARRMCSGLGIASSFSKGTLFTEGVFYPGCPEIILYSRDESYTVMDLWRGWKDLQAVTVVNHPISDLTMVELGVKNSITIDKPDLAVINIDIPLLAAQWKMWQAANPGKLIEAFLTQVVLLNMVKSHLNVALFNKLMVDLNIREECSVRTNLPSSQTSVNAEGQAIIFDVFNKVSGKAMTGGQMMASIPAIFGSNYLDSVCLPSMTPTYQVEWALMAQKMDSVAVMLALAAKSGYDRILPETTILKRTFIQVKEEKTLDNGLTGAASAFLNERLQRLVVERMPKA